jgi:DNA replication factor GINS
MADGARTDPRIEAIQNVYQIGFMTEEVRVSYKKDVKMAVGGLTIDAKEGDLSSLPRCAAKILAQQNAVEVQNENMASDISRTINRERIAKAHDLSAIDVDFYVRVNDYLESLKERERESLMDSLNEFVDSRLAKISKLAAASPLSTELESKLSAEEKETYLSINKSASDFKAKVLKKFG